MKAVILAAGKGTRMKHLSADRPKHLVPVDGKPVLEHVVERVRAAGVTDLILVVGYLGHMIQDYFGDGSRFGVRINYITQDPPTGTGSAVHAAEELVAGEPFFMTFGDVLVCPEAYTGMVENYQASPCDALLLLNWVEDPFRGAAVYLDDTGRIVRIVEKPPQGTSTTHWNQSGMFIFSPLVFSYTGKLTLSPRGEYELTDATYSMIANGRNIRGFSIEGGWCDVGTPDDVAKAEGMIRK